MTDLHQDTSTNPSSDTATLSTATTLSANAIHNELQKLANSNFEQGDLFERVIMDYLRVSALYRDQVAQVWQWRDWARNVLIDQIDIGIDLVVLTHDNEYWAVQCKCYEPHHYLQKGDIDSFLASIGQSWGGVRFSRGLIVATTPNWSKHAEGALDRRDPPCIRLDMVELARDESVDWADLLPGKKDRYVKPIKRSLKPHQREAVNDVIRRFKEADRGKLIMACGTGKTYTALKIAEEQVPAGGYVLFLVPSLSLLSQTLREWAIHHKWAGLRTFAVCSDRKVGKNNEDINAYDLVIPPTTDGARLFYGLQPSSLPAGREATVQVVFATYQSIAVVHQAQQQGAPEFDLVICDEAHRTTGVDVQDRDTSYYIRVHDNDYLKAKKRLYMTATPRIYSESAKQRAKDKEAVVFSMDDETKFGTEFHRLDFSKAVAQDLLSDYKVLILMVDEKQTSKDALPVLSNSDNLKLDDTARIIGCWNGLSKRFQPEEAEAAGITDFSPMRRAVAFTSTIKASEKVAEYFSAVVQAYRKSNPDDLTALYCGTKHVDGTQNALIRNQALQWLRDEPEEDACHILSNVRCLSEGVDVPALDAVLFLSGRSSQIDVVQSVGRVMRKAEGKDCGYVILPICVSADATPEKALQQEKNFETVWQVLRALRAHDDRFNAEINQINLNRNKGGRVNIFGGGGGQGDGEDDGTGDDIKPTAGILIPADYLDQWKDALYARMVLKCGDRRYWESWAKDVADIARHHITRINTLIKDSEADYREIFDEFMAELRQNINPQVSEEDAIEMLAQHLITRPVFDALFENYEFIGNNPVSKTMQAMLELLDEQNLATETDSLAGFYESVRERASGVDNAEGRQKIVIELYEHFFKTAFPKMAKSLGIVYTPVEVVDFILQSVNHLLKEEFEESLSSENVHVLDPFTGTGTFMSRLLGSSLVADADLERKYCHELHANEIVLLAYYIAAVNIEAIYHERLQVKHRNGGDDAEMEYESFPGIVLTDTFQINERDGDMLDQIFPVNSKRVLRQKDTPIRVVLGNPPYSAGQRSANENNANLSYPKLDGNIADSYAEHSKATLKNSLYDSYIRAFRWASDRIGDEGIIAYVSNGGWLDGNAMDGFRRCLAEEFSDIYCFNLRGNARTSGELRRKEKDNVFGQGTRTNVAILFLVKKKDATGECHIRYHDIGDYLNRQQKLDIIKGFGSVGKMEDGWRAITPNNHYDWINQRNEEFLNYMPLGDKENKRNQGTTPSVFTLYSSGVKTNRDAWAYNFSKAILTGNMQKTIMFYNSEVERYQQECKRKKDDERPEAKDFINYDSTLIHWDRSNKKEVGQNKASEFNTENLRTGNYRPFCKQWLYFDKQWNNDRYQQPKVFPKPDTRNLAVCVSGIGASKDFSALMVDTVPNLHFMDTGPMFSTLPLCFQ